MEHAFVPESQVFLSIVGWDIMTDTQVYMFKYDEVPAYLAIRTHEITS